MSVNISTNTVTVSENTATGVVTASTPGPQGTPGNFAFNETAKVDKSVLYWDAASSSYKADEIVTTSTLVDGGNF